MPFTPQKKDRGKPGFWPKPSPRAPRAVPGPAVSLQLVEHPATSAATSAANLHCYLCYCFPAALCGLLAATRAAR